MRLDLSICASSDVIDCVRAHDTDDKPFGVVISIEGLGEGAEGKAPQLQKELGAQWADRQLILACSDIESGPAAPGPELVRRALEHLEKYRSTDEMTRVLVHCRRGKSRSAALGLVLLRDHHGPGSEKECLDELLRIRPVAAPNLAIVRHGDALLRCNGALVRAVERDQGVTRRRAEATAARTPFSALVSWHVGLADTARAQILGSIAARERLNEPALIATSLTYACLLFAELREPVEAQEASEHLLEVTSRHALPKMASLATAVRGWALVARGQINEGLSLMHGAIDAETGLGVMVLLIEAQLRADQLSEAMLTIERILPVAKKSAIEHQSVVWRRGVVHLRRGEIEEAERDFLETRTIARRLGSKAFELRAATSLARLLRDTGRRDEARAMLTEIYNCFTEGFDTADLKDAKALLDELGGSP